MNKDKPILELLQEAMEGREKLPKGFCLPDENGSEVKFAPGAMDGIILYHCGTPPKEDNEGRLLLKEAMWDIAKGAEKEAFAKVQEYAGKGRAVSDIDFLLNHIRANLNEFVPEKFYRFACRLVGLSAKAEAVKIGMGILELFDTNHMPKMKEVVRTLSYYDEFAFFGCFVVMTGWDKRDEELLEIARRNHGWGRIHGVAFVEPVTEEIKNWLLIHGVHNDVLANYSAMECYRKAEVRSLLGQPLTRVQFMGCTDILNALLDDEPEPGISALQDGEEVLWEYLGALEKRDDLTKEDMEIVERIRSYGAENFGEDGKWNRHFPGEG